MRKIKNTTGKTVSFFPIEREFEALKTELHLALYEVGYSGQVVLGPKVAEFESELARRISRKYAVSCASGTDAITLALKALGIENENEVIIPANSYPSVFGVALSGATPIFVDVEYGTGGIDPKKIKEKITRKTRAILVVHLYGMPAQVAQVMKICNEKQLLLIEDCAQSFGAKINGKPTGSFGHLAVFSFYPTKNLGALGDGGAIVTDSRDVYNSLRALRMYGEKERCNSERLGMNSRLDEVQAAFLLKKLTHINEWMKKRYELAQIYRKELNKLPEITLLPVLKNIVNSYHLFPIRTNRRDELQRWLSKHSIQTSIHYPKSLHQIKTFSRITVNQSFPISEKWNKTTLSLPLHPYHTEKEICYVAREVVNFFVE